MKSGVHPHDLPPLREASEDAAVTPEIARRDAQVGIVVELTRADLRLREALEHHAAEMELLDAVGRRRSMSEQIVEDAPANENATVIFAERDLELDRGFILVPARLAGKGEHEGDDRDGGWLTDHDISRREADINGAAEDCEDAP